MPKFVLKDMEGLYIEEMNAAINLLKVTFYDLYSIIQMYTKSYIWRKNKYFSGKSLAFGVNYLSFLWGVLV